MVSDECGKCDDGLIFFTDNNEVSSVECECQEKECCKKAREEERKLFGLTLKTEYINNWNDGFSGFMGNRIGDIERILVRLELHTFGNTDIHDKEWNKHPLKIKQEELIEKLKEAREHG